MNILWTTEQKAWLHRCIQHIHEAVYDDLFDLDLSQIETDDVKAYFHANQHPLYTGPKSSWPSLYLSTENFKQSLYHQNIVLDELLSEKDVSFEKITLKAHHLFNLDAIHFDPHQECQEWMNLKALDQDLETLSLKLNGDVWMLDVPSESATIDPIAQQASGKLVSFGLGIGYFVYMAMKNPKVESITVIEKNPKVIELFQKYLEPQFPKQIPLNIIEGDAMDYFTAEYLSTFESLFVDVYQSIEDGLVWMEKLLAQHQPTQTCDFWIESSITSILPSLWVLYFDLKLKKKKIHHREPSFHRMLKKMDQYSVQTELNIESLEALKDFVYDPKRHREILSIQL